MPGDRAAVLCFAITGGGPSANPQAQPQSPNCDAKLQDKNGPNIAAPVDTSMTYCTSHSKHCCSSMKRINPTMILWVIQEKRCTTYSE